MNQLIKWASWVFISITLGLYFFKSQAGLSIPEWLIISSRWLAVWALIGWAAQRRNLTTWILVSMAAGIATGLDFPEFSNHLNVLSKIFLKLIKTIVAPLIFGTLVVGIAGHSNIKQVGRMGLKSMLYFYAVTTIALFIGLAAINISQAGAGIELPREGTESEKIEQLTGAHKKRTTSDIILHIFPENIAKSVSEGEVLQVVVFSVLFGVALALVQEEKKQPFLSFAESLSEVMFKFTHIIMYYAPVAVFAAIAYTVGKTPGALLNLLKLLATLYVALIFFLVAVLLPIAWFIRLPIRSFIKAIAEPVSIAFATTSSEAALPRAMEAMESLGVPRKIVAFVMPTGYTFNLDGTTLYLSLASVFVAQAAGIYMDWKEQLFMALTLIITSKGVAGVPRASLVILSGTAAQFNLPAEPIFIILGIDALMDMARTSVNVIGNCLATAVIARWEGELGKTEILQ
ncbi:MAG: cation:dicarboxylase symporter family transporter [Bacteroidia bacterium]|nr:cation:dicarboxylase symporter family transporter [Bacteroidia bacterium]MDW8159179.1 cation:dicarboxylase symporter family transporter [Bacteroidia bacterium]